MLLKGMSGSRLRLSMWIRIGSAAAANADRKNVLRNVKRSLHQVFTQG